MRAADARHFLKGETMKIQNFKSALMVMASVSTLALVSTAAHAQEDGASEEREQLTVLGSRNTQAR